uniref:Uncharacterized protein n=1 Tax=Anguilla anguilla TaxID=7936 RepID=A0A0E9W7I7_ANGAN
MRTRIKSSGLYILFGLPTCMTDYRRLYQMFKTWGVWLIETGTERVGILGIKLVCLPGNSIRTVSEGVALSPFDFLGLEYVSSPFCSFMLFFSCFHA